MSYLPIIIGIAILAFKVISSISKKNPPQGTPHSSQQPSIPQNSKESFEDLLAVFDMENKIFEQKNNVSSYSTTQDRMGNSTREDRIESLPMSNHAYAAFSGNAPQKLDVNLTPTKRYKEFKIKKKEPNKYLKQFKNPQSAKDAIVASEILKRKYF
jgi:hypothetical protein